MDRDNNYFIMSGFLSISLFIFFLSLFIYMLFTTKEQKSYALTKKNYVSVSIVTPKNIAKFSSSASAVKSLSKSVSKDIDVNDLFSDVWTQKIATKPKLKKVNSKRIQDIAKKIKVSDANSVNSISKKIEKIDESKDNKDKEKISAANEVNEYLAKIQSIVYQYFNVPPNTEGNSVKTVIELDPLGRLIDFRVLNYSANAALNDEVDKIKERLKNVVFPKNPQNSSSKTIVVLISKE